MDSELLGNLVNSLDPSYRLKPYLGFELRQVYVALTCLGYDLLRF